MKAFIHIGTSKTGTTTLQTCLHGNRDRLLERYRTLCPRSMGERSSQFLFACYGVDKSVKFQKHRHLKRFGITNARELDAFREKIRSDLLAEVQATSPERFVVSSEHLYEYVTTERDILKIKSLVDEFADEARVIVYLRRQDQRLLSTYSQMIKGGLTPEFSLPDNVKWRRDFNYQAVLQPWSDVFGRENISVGVLERSSLRNGDLLDDFLARIGLDDAELERPVTANESLSADVCEFLRLMNALIPVTVDGHKGPNPARANLVLVLERLSKSREKLTLSPQQAERFLALYKESNAAVAHSYLGKSDGALFSDMKFSQGKVEPGELDVETAIEIAAHLWKIKQTQVDRLLANNIRLKKQLDNVRPRKSSESV